MRDTPAMLRELKVVEQRYQAVLQVLDGIPVTEVAKRLGVARQTVHRWVARYRDNGIDGLADRSHAPRASAPISCAGGKHRPGSDSPPAGAGLAGPGLCR